MKMAEEQLVSSEIILLLCVDLGQEIATDELSEELKGQNWIKKIEKQKLYGLESYILPRRQRPLLLILYPFGVAYDKIDADIQPEIRIYPTGACCLRLRITLNDKTIDETINLIRMLTLHRKEAILTSQNLVLGENLKRVIQGLIDKVRHGESPTNTRDKIAGKWKTQYITIRLKNSYPPMSKETLLSTCSRELAGLISWRPDWRDFGDDYVQYLISSPVLTKHKNALVIVKFPASFLYLPNVPERTYELYLLTIELGRVQLQFLKVFADILDIHFREINKIFTVKKGSNSNKGLSKMLWNINKLKLEILRSTDETMRIRDIIPIHRLLWVFDRLAEESMIQRQYSFVQMRLNAISGLVKDCYDFLHLEHSSREQRELYYLQAIFVIGVASQLATLYFIQITNFTWLGVPLTITTIISGLALFYIFRILISKIKTKRE